MLIIAIVSYLVTFLIRPQSPPLHNESLVLTQPNYTFFKKLTSSSETELITSLATPLSVHTFSCDEMSTATAVLNPFILRPMTTMYLPFQPVDYRSSSTGIRLLAGSRLVYAVNITIMNENVCTESSLQPPDPNDCLNVFLFNSSQERSKSKLINSSSFCFENESLAVNESLVSELVFDINDDGVYYFSYNYSSNYCTTVAVSISGSVVYYQVPSDSIEECTDFSSSTNCTIRRSCSPFCASDGDVCLYITNSSSVDEEGYFSYLDSPGLFYNYRVFTFFTGVAVSAFFLLCFFSCLFCCCLFCCCSLYDCLKEEEGPYDSNCI